MIAPALPFPPVGGTPVRTYQLLRYLAGRHMLTLLTYGGPQNAEQASALERLGVSVQLVEQNRPAGHRKRRAQLASLFWRASYQRRRFSSRAMQEAIARLLRRHAFDAVQVELSQMGGFRFDTGGVLLLDEHNIEYEVLYRMFRTEKSVIRKIFNRVEYVKVRHEERRAWKRFDGCVLTSERDRAILRRSVTSSPTAVVPNGVDLDHFHPIDTPPHASRIVFTGSMDYRPNVDAVIFFVRDILPRVLRARPDVSFAIVGMRPPEEVRRLAGPNVIVTGSVPDVRQYVWPAGVVVAPLSMGGGTRLKLLEAMAMGKGIVSTSLGCEGLAVRSGAQLLVADDPQHFAQEVLRLMDDPMLAQELGRRGRALVERQYGWASVGELLNSFLAEMVAAKRAGTLPARSQLEAVVT